MLRPLRPLLLTFFVFSVVVASARETCSELVQDALFAVDEFCSELGRNQACYGNVDLTAEAQPDADDFFFESLGDIVDVADIASLQLSELNEEAGQWGVAVMALQADIPNTLPGQNVTFILFGDVSIENAATDEQTPMQAFYLRTGIGQTACEEAPESGLLVQTPDGVEEVTFNINGVDVQIGSTVLFSTEDSSDSDELNLVLAPVEGSAAVIFDDEVYPAIEGTEIRMPINQQLLPTGRPGLPQAYNQNRMARLPVQQMPRRVEAARALADGRIAELHERIQNGEAPCGVEGLPSCDRVITALRNGINLPPPDRWGMRFEPGVNCVPRTDENATDDNRTLPFCPPTNRADRPAPLRALANNALDFNADVDDDGILNGDDACPMTAGVQAFSGCSEMPPDTDDDGITDALDLCPYHPGEAERLGCPELSPDQDADSDGIPDARDTCPVRPGEVETNGCPQNNLNSLEEDTRAGCRGEDAPATCDEDPDGDGITNAIDNCPARPGTVENNGCPPPDAPRPDRP